MADDPTDIVKPKWITPGRVIVQYIDQNGRRVTICPPAYAEGAEGRGSARPKDYLDLDE